LKTNNVTGEAKILVEKKNQKKQQELDISYKFKLKPYEERKTELNDELEKAGNLYNTAETDFITETDGTGGTKTKGYKDVARQKEIIMDKRAREYNALNDKLSPQLEVMNAKIDSINSLKITEYNDYVQNNSTDGFITQTTALYSLIKENPFTLGFRYLLLSLIFILIELSALISKFLFKTESYQSQVSRKNAIELTNSENNKAIVLYNSNESKKYELAKIDEFLQKIKPAVSNKIQKLIDEWNEESTEQKNYKDVLQSFMDKFVVQGIGLNKDSNEVEIKQKKKAEEEEQYYKKLNNIVGNTFVFIIFSLFSANVILYFLLPIIPEKQLAFLYHTANTLSIIMSIYTFINNKKTAKK
jgi:hypothetical protein